jgi:diguanylate cyclase (GGDEF) domain
MITLNPIKKSNLVAFFLCTFSLIFALYDILIYRNLDVLPGVLVPMISAGVSLLISNYGRNLNKQIERVLEYSRIVKKNDVLLHRLAFYDTLTGLPNRKMIIDQIDKLTNPAFQGKNEFLFAYLDLDEFKRINDYMGHSAGDAILRQVAQKWKLLCHKEDLLGRVGGDEFAILIRHKMSRIELMEYLESFWNTLTDAIIVENKEFTINVSCGITRYPEDGSSAEELFKNADIALYKAKNSGKKNFQFFNKKLQDDVLKKIRIENGLSTAIRNNELYMVFQPQYRISTRELRGYEALIRWKNPELGLMNPAVFIPITEENGMIVEIGEWIIETVLRKFMEFKQKYDITAVISINISVVQMIEPSFVPMIKELLNKTGFDGRYLELEITESVFISYPEHVIEIMEQLNKLNIRFALDDFGTGYASLNYLQMLPINLLKIDKTFIDKITDETSKNQIIGSIIMLSHQLGMEVIAEGVEEEEQLDYLLEQNCDYVQGYLLSRPMEEEQIIKNYIMKQTVF